MNDKFELYNHIRDKVLKKLKSEAITISNVSRGWIFSHKEKQSPKSFETESIRYNII